jgi:hypothetical protein
MKTRRHTGKVYRKWNVYFIFLYSIQNIFHSDKYLANYAQDMSRNACRSRCKVIIKIIEPNGKLNWHDNFCKIL